MESRELLDEWEITLKLRSAHNERPDKWDYTVLLDLNTGKGEQAWVERAGILKTGTEEDLEFLANMPE